MTWFRDLDLWLFRLGNAAGAAGWLDSFFLWLTAPPARGLIFLLLAAALAILGGRRGRAAILLIVLAVTIADLAGAQLLKPGLDRLRPCFALPEATLLLPRQAHSPSFPSNHAANAFAAAVVLFTVSRTLGIGGILVAGLIAYSRVYLGVHYPSDLLGGALLGLFISLALNRLYPEFIGFVELVETSRFRRRK